MSKNLKLLILIFLCLTPSALSLKCHVCMGNLFEGVPQGNSAKCTDPSALDTSITLQPCDNLHHVDHEFQLSAQNFLRSGSTLVFKCFKRSRMLPSSEIIKRGCYAGLESEDNQCRPPTAQEIEANDKLNSNKVNFDLIKQETCYCAGVDGCNSSYRDNPSFLLIVGVIGFLKVIIGW